MASGGLREELSCTICLNLYTHPVLLKCGHSFCRKCIVAVLNTQERSGRYSCPECKEQYTERPPLNKNRKLWKIVDNFRTTYKEETEVLCTYCDSPVPATKSCLHCDHEIIKLETIKCAFETVKCSAHQKVLKYYCTEDGACICMSCRVAGDHKGHKVELLNEAFKKTKEKLGESLNKMRSETQETERKIQNLKNHKRESDKIAALSGRLTELFRDSRKCLDDAEKNVLSERSRQREQNSVSLGSNPTDGATEGRADLEDRSECAKSINCLKKVPNRDDSSPEKK